MGAWDGCEVHRRLRLPQRGLWEVPAGCEYSQPVLSPGGAGSRRDVLDPALLP